MKREEIEKDTFDMISWAFGLGQHQKTLRQCVLMLQEIQNEKKSNETLDFICQQLEFISFNMEP